MTENREDAREYDTDHGRTALQQAVTGEGGSALRKYQTINVGRTGLLALLGYELYTMFVAPMPGAFGYLLRKWCAKRFLGACGRGVVIGRNVTIRHPKKIRIGDHTAVDDYAVLDAKGDGNRGIRIGSGVMIGRNVVLSCKDGDLEIGDNTNIAQGCLIQSGRSVTVGANVLFGAFCYLVGGGDHRSERTDVPIIRQGQVIRGIRVADNVWLGADVKVLDGVNVGRDAILGSGAVVNTDVPEFAVAAGVPARVLRDRRAPRDGAVEGEPAE
jgi:acetyltransferase-like isoleucine patch superfamily enzyme